MPNVIREDIVRISWDIEKNPLTDITKDLDALRDKIKKVGGDQAKLKQLNKEFKDLNGQRLNKLSKSVDKVTKKIGTGLVSAAKKAGQAVANIGKTVIGGAIAGGAALGGAALSGAVLGVNYNAEMETYRTSFEVMTGSAEKAIDVVGRLQKMGAATPFEMTDLAKTTQLLMNYGFTADDAMNRMSMLGDIAQGNADKMNSIATAYGQMSSAGKVSLEDVKQMIEAGFNPLQEISQSTGESMASLYERISKGKISVDEITASMKRSTSEGGRYFQSMDKQSKTFSGQLSTLKDGFNNLLGTITGGVFKKLAQTVMPKINDLIGKLTEAFNEDGFSGMLSALFGELGLVGKKLQTVKNAFNTIKTAAQDVIGVIQTIIDKVKAFVENNEKMQIIKDTFGKIKTTVQNLASIIGTVAEEVWNFVTSTGVLTTVKTVFEGISTAVTWAKEHLNGILEVVKSVGLAFVITAGLIKVASTAFTVYTTIKKTLKTIETISTAAQLGFNAALLACPVTWIVAAIVALIAIIVLLVRNWDKVKEAAVKCWEWIKNIWGKASTWMNANVIEPVKNFFQNFYYFIVGLFTIIKDWIVSIWTPIAGWVNSNVIQPVVTFFTGLWNKVSPVIENVWNWICDIWGKISGWVDSNIIQPVASFFSGLWDNITGGVDSVKEAITGAFQKAWDKVTQIWEGITSFFSGLWDGIKNIVGKIIDKGKEAKSEADSVKAANNYRGGLISSPTLSWVGEKGAEMIIPLTNYKNRGVSLWEKAGQMLGVNPTPQISVAGSGVSLPRYTPSSTVSNSTSSMSATNNYSPQFTLNLSGTVDRTTERTVKQWIKEALQDTFDGMGRTNPRLTEV